ncbi:hypothetical protein [Nocardia sp. MDA0666]|uniref:hypothetical protein n=1 Tax=Nocardia sp. MDA0666 TaxID=2135448 RepID=UPI0018EBC7A6|nr:hypothetical protein [Nocardia sp. MDA0666]
MIGELRELGVDTDRLPPRRPAIRYCVDWSEHRHHLAGGLGAALTADYSTWTGYAGALPRAWST